METYTINQWISTLTEEDIAWYLKEYTTLQKAFVAQSK